MVWEYYKEASIGGLEEQAVEHFSDFYLNVWEVS